MFIINLRSVNIELLFQVQNGVYDACDLIPYTFELVLVVYAAKFSENAFLK
jgi:hypothetical protein